VLDGWDESPPPFLGARWARLSAAERAIAAALGSLDGGRREAHATGALVDLLASGGFPIGPVEVGALVPRLVECELVEREGDRVRFRHAVDARFVARHRPLSQEAASGAEVIGPYEVLETIGSGGMGTVYKARRLDTRVLVALKVVHPHLLSTPEMRRRFVREGEIGVRVSHPGIVRFVERGEAAGRAYIAMEFLPGRTVKELVLRLGPLPAAFAAGVVRDLADAASALHDAGVVHRDFKSENVIVSPAGVPRLLDFGLAQVAGVSRHTVSGNIVGTPDTMAPEQVRGEPAGPATDVWALGVVLYEMLAGTPPFHRDGTVATFKAILEDPPLSLRIGRPELPRALEEVVLAALEKDPAARTRSAARLRDALSALLPSLPAEPLPPEAFEEPASAVPSDSSAPTGVL
jgi:serine/threonine-protein kinase